MCGIAGIVSINQPLVQQHIIQLMTDSLRHRGPDGQGVWMNDMQQVALGHRRLAILDTSNAAAQPMHFLHYTIVHNGELYNYIELRSILLQKGYQFHTQSDTEVMVAAYDYWKEDCLQYFDGMFAFAIWDDRLKKLFAARDLFGEKPFFYHHHEMNAAFYFGSEIKALWATGIDKKMRDEALLQFLALGTHFDGNNPMKSYYKDIAQLPAGHFLYYHVTTNLLTVSRYRDINYKDVSKAHEDHHLTRFKTLFEEGIKKRLRSDVPLGCSLSGGIDSSAIIAMMKSMEPALSIQSFSAIFPGFERDESNAIQLVCNHLQISNHTVIPSAEGLVSEFEKLCYHHEQPFDSASVYAQYKVFELANQHGIKVLLDGQGADEVLGGYTKYIHWYLQELFSTGSFAAMRTQKNRLVANGYTFNWGLKNYAAAVFPATAQQQVQLKTDEAIISNPHINKDFASAYVLKATVPKPVVHALNDILYYDCMQGPLQVLLRNADRNAMAHGCEVRLPFLTPALVDFIFSLPAAYKMNNGYTKSILRNTVSDLLPQPLVWNTKKVGFEPPQFAWMQTAGIQEYIRYGKEKLVKENILKASVLDLPFTATDAYVQKNNDWRWLVAGKML